MMDVSNADVTLLVEAFSALMVLLTVLMVTSIGRSRFDQRRWQETREELHRMDADRMRAIESRIEGLETRINRIIPIAAITVKGREVQEQNEEIEGVHAD